MVKAKRKRKSKKRGVRWVLVEKWQELLPLDIVKITMGTGPYTVIKATGEKLMMGETGVYTIHSLDNKGLHCFEVGGIARIFLYMGKPYQNEITGTFMEPYKLRKKVVEEG